MPISEILISINVSSPVATSSHIPTDMDVYMYAYRYTFSKYIPWYDNLGIY